jgi:uncharacterized caspase-like protein
MIQPPGAVAPVPAAENGLAIVRGPDPVARPGVPAASLGMVIGFAASPGHPALDGPPDGNSPYAAALLKHLSAGGYSFADVMTMVGQEVYLKTRSLQRPWVNSSLLRVLTFGKPIEDADPDETAIRDGRRQLLLTIGNDLTPATRSAVENMAGSEGVPLDALYGMLKQLSVDTSGGQGDLEAQLREGARQLKLFKEQQLGTASSDAELQRLADLATRAQEEGAIKLALTYREKATARAEVLKGERDKLEAGLKADRLEIGATFANHAQVAALNFDYAKSAEMWGRAYDEVARWDDDLALTYKWGEAGALRDYGDFRADNAALEKAIATYEEAAALAPRDRKPAQWASIQNDYGWALYTLGERNRDPQRLKRAIDVLTAAVAATPPWTSPNDAAISKMNLANAISALGQRESDSTHLKDAVALYEDALSSLPRTDYGYTWGRLEMNLGTTLAFLGDREEDPRTLVRALAALESALEEVTQRLSPLEWAQTQNSYGMTLMALGTREHDIAMLRRAETALNHALEERHEDNAPLDWAMSEANLGSVYAQLSDETGGDRELLNKALDALRAGLTQLTRETIPPLWATAQANMGTVLVKLGGLTGDREMLGQAVDAFNLALQVRTEALDPQNWAFTQFNLSMALTQLGSDEVSPGHLQDAVEAANAALRQWTQTAQPLYWARAKYALGNAFAALGNHELGTESFLRAVDAYNDALWEFDPQGSPVEWLRTTKNLARVLVDLGDRESSTGYVQQAIAQFGNVLTMVTAASDPGTYGWANYYLAACYETLDARGVPDQFPKAIEALRAALDGYNRDAFPELWAEVQADIGDALYVVSDRAGGIAGNLREAIAAYEASQEVYVRADHPLAWARAEHSIGSAYADWGKLVGDRALIATGRDHVRAAWDVYKADSARYDAQFAAELAALDQALANMS